MLQRGCSCYIVLSPGKLSAANQITIMEHIKNDVASFYCLEEFLPPLVKLCEIVRRSPACIKPFRGANKKMAGIFAEEGFQLYSTVKKTTLLYDPASMSFLKILHPMNLKSKGVFLFINKAKSIYNISEQLSSKGIKIAQVVAYGVISSHKRPFFAMKKLEGESLYNILIRGKKTLPMETYIHVADDVVRLHQSGYWLGDAHLSHIFIKDGNVTGLIDIDSIRKNHPFMLRHLAKDLAGLNHPSLPVTADEKKKLLDYYLGKVKITNEKKFLQMVKHYTEQRWKA